MIGIGLIIGGRGKYAGRGAGLGAAVGRIGGGVHSGQNREFAYERYFNACMGGVR